MKVLSEVLFKPSKTRSVDLIVTSLLLKAEVMGA